MSVFNSLANTAASPPRRTFGWNALTVSVQQGIMLHVTGFFIGSFLAWFGFARGSIVKTVLALTGLLAFGAILETSQLLTAYRYFSFKDMIANGLGIGLFLLCLPFMSRFIKHP